MTEPIASPAHVNSTPQPSPRPRPDEAAERFQAALGKAAAARPLRRTKTDQPPASPEAGAVGAAERAGVVRAQQPSTSEAGPAQNEPPLARPVQAPTKPAPAAAPTGADGAFERALERVNTNQPKPAELALRFVNELGPLAGVGVQRLPDGALSLNLAFNGAGPRPADKALETLRRRLAVQGLDLAIVSIEESFAAPSAPSSPREDEA